MKRLQFVNWFPRWRGFDFIHYVKKDKNEFDLWRIYDWFLVIGFWEIRKLKIQRPKLEGVR
jgi:hypothetical protein